jgi:hypothetical protein
LRALRGESLQGFGGFDFWAHTVMLDSLYCNLSINNVYGLPISVNHNIQGLKWDFEVIHNFEGI